MFGVKEITTLIVAGAIGGVSFGGVNELVASVDSKEFRSSVGVSEVVYECAERVLAEHSDDELIALIEASGDVGTVNETPVQYSLKVCAEKDPFGWSGTDQEWALDLLK